MNRFSGRPPGPHELADRLVEMFKGSTERMRIVVFDGDEHGPPRVEGTIVLKHPVDHVEVMTKIREVMEP